MSLWQRLRGTAAKPAAEARRWVVVDVETSGLDVQHDRLLAIAAVGLRLDGKAAPRITLGDSFEAVLRQDSSLADKSNILLHGIGVGEQRAGVPAAEVLAAFETWLAGAPLVAFHAPFDQAMITRAMAAALGRTPASPWLDLEPVADALFPEVGGRTLDDWLAHFGIDCAVRHQAAADTFATAELLLRLWPAARRQRCTSFAAWRQLAEQRRWLARR
ncbi:MAG: 3'-5' exonuclease [Pseudomonadota bacterium]